MRLAWKEMRRRPRRFLVAAAVLTLIVVLLLFLGGLLDGLYNGSTGAISAQRADVIVFSSTSRDSFLRSRIDLATRRQVGQVPGVRSVGGLSIALLTATPAGKNTTIDIALIGYEQAATGIPRPPAPGAAYVDDRLDADGIRAGTDLVVGRDGTRLNAVGSVADASYLLQGGVWVDEATWRSTVTASRPDLTVADGVVQALVVQGSGDAATLARNIDRATGGVTSSLTRDEAVLTVPGVKEQKSTFLQIIGVTLAIAAVVIGLFFSLLTIERTGLYGVLKALGSSSGQLFVGVVAQAVTVSVISLLAGGAITLALASAVPATVPIQLTGYRAAFVAVGMIAAAVFGSVVSLRRVVRIDPASAIGTAS